MLSRNAAVVGNSRVRSLVCEASYDLSGKDMASAVPRIADNDLAIQFTEDSFLGGAVL